MRSRKPSRLSGLGRAPVRAASRAAAAYKARTGSASYSYVDMIRSSEGPMAPRAPGTQDGYEGQLQIPQRTATETKSCFRFTSFSA